MGNLLRLLGRRLISLPFVAFGVVFLVFFLMSFSQYDPAVSALGENATAEQLAAYRHEMGFDRSWGEQFLSYLGGLFQGNLGVYGVNKDSVSSRIATAFPITLQLTFIALIIAVVFSVIFGVLAALYRDTWVDQVIRVISIIAIATPSFWLGVLLIYLLQIKLALAAVFVSILGQSMFGIIAAIGILYVPQIARIVRANIISEYGKDYVRAVIVSGARAPWILYKHVMRNIAAPVMVFTTLCVADAIVFEASLSFINLGIPEPTPTWGNILSSAKEGVIFGYWWQALFPGLMIMITVLCLNILSEGITDAMVAAPTAPIEETDEDKEAKREEDRLLVDPVAAYAAQRESLEESLAKLREAEMKRTDRFEPKSTEPPVIEVKDLCIKFPRHGDVNVVDHVSFSVRPGETMGLVGESGCGKSITSLAIMGLLDPKAEISGEILFDGKNLVGMDPKEHNALRGHEIAMIYQDALSSLNPSMLIKAQMKQLTSRGGTRSAEELLKLVGLDPERTLESYPHELSGGQRQRVLIAMALTRDPKLVVADEPTTALDVTVQKQVIDLLNELREKLGFAMIFVSHDLALVAKVAHSITVMYAGQVVEQGSTKEILTDPRHEYTRGLLGAVTSIEAGAGRLHQVPGTVPSPADFPKGDRFAPRSSHPTVGLNTRPIFKQVPGTYHFYAALPDDADVTPAVDAPTAISKEGGAR